ncbi:hypothetical protein ACFLRB_06375, partial [Acidobacteriota bacterium]
LFTAFVALMAVIVFFFLSPGEEKPVITDQPPVKSSEPVKDEALKIDRKPAMSPGQLISNLKTREFCGYLMSYHLKNQDLINLLKHMSNDTGLNFNFQPGVKGHVTCELEDIPWDETLHLFLEQNDMEIILGGETLIVKKKSGSLRSSKKPDLSPEQLMKNFKTRKYTGKPGKFHLEEYDLVNFILSTARDTGLNIFIKSGVKGTVNYKKDNVPWDQALHLFLEQNDMEMKLEGTILVVQPKEKYPTI